ncbi:MAG TPA: TetR family transcriptional regulator [Alphaproteobacteria bacterium]|nr:TetR family transcriptional regulator [Alphaproteobacteria bacterium]
MAMGDLSEGQLRILQAVARLLENPANKITVQRIAAEIHVTDGAIYRHYKSKDEIFEAIASYMEVNLLGPFNKAAQTEPDLVKRLETVFSQLMAFVAGHPGLARMLLGGGSTEAAPMAERLKLLNGKVRAQLFQILKPMEVQGLLARDVTPEQATELMFGLVAGTALAYAFALPQVAMEAKWKLAVHSLLRAGASVA